MNSLALDGYTPARETSRADDVLADAPSMAPISDTREAGRRRTVGGAAS